jgi:hypothetical protein
MSKRSHEIADDHAKTPDHHDLAHHRQPHHSANWDGRSTQQAIDRWSERASSNSPQHEPGPATTWVSLRYPDPPHTPSTGKIALADTSAPPRENHHKSRQGYSSYMAGVKRHHTAE